jgi:hypothetical protein
MRHLLIAASGVFACLSPAQDLRRGLQDATAVLVGRPIGKTAHDEHVVLHRIQVVVDVRGAAEHRLVTVLDWPQLALHQRPTPRQSRLFCLQDATATAARLGWAGSHPLVGADHDADPTLRFARLLAASEAGAPPTDTATGLVGMALGADPAIRLEATRLLTERGDLRSKLGEPTWNQLLARATGEIEDVPYKIALAELCAEQRLDGVFDTLLVSLGQVTDADYARTVGRIGRVLHGEEVTVRIDARLRQAGQAADRQTLLLALGASNTQSALDALLRLDAKDAAVEAALREHRSPRARDAVASKRAK